MKKPVTFVTGNPKKLEEFKAIMGTDLPIVSANVNRMFSENNRVLKERISSI